MRGGTGFGGNCQLAGQLDLRGRQVAAADRQHGEGHPRQPTGLGYAAVTIGGPRQATFGMRMAGLRVETANGGRPDGLAAAVHALLFYVAASTVGLWALDVLIGFARSDRRMGHDLLTGLVVVRA